MGAVKRFGRSECVEVRGAALKALETTALRYGLTVEAVGGSYTPGDYTLRVRFSVARADGMPAGKTDWDRWCGSWGLKPEDFGRVVRHPVSGEEYRVVGLRARARRNPILGARVKDGRVFCLPVSLLKPLFGSVEVAPPPPVEPGDGEDIDRELADGIHAD